MTEIDVAADFKLKGSTLTVVVLEISRYLPKSFPAQLQEKISQAPEFFQGASVLINLKKLTNDSDKVNFDLLISQCRQLGVQPVAFKGVNSRFSQAISKTGLASLSDASSKAKTTALRLPDPAVHSNTAKSDPSKSELCNTDGKENGLEDKVIIKTVVEEKIVRRASKVITTPVRSGQQVYAEGTDLIVMSQVSEGAELLADGNIHVYGALRGRALAGVMGDKNARIFCQQMEAEIISVAGNFLLSESLPTNLRKQPAQVYLLDEVLNVVPL